MGLISAVFNAATGVLADQWIDFISCSAMPENILMRPGTRPEQKRSSNTKGSENIISNGSKINVADGQCMLIVENGKIADFCAQPGQYTYNNKIAPSLLGGGFKDLGTTFKDIGLRFTAGGASTNQQFVYYINTKEIIGNKIGWGNVPFRDSEFQMTVRVQGFGQYSFRIIDPLLFYTNIVGNITTEYKRDDLVSQMKSEVIAALQPALGRIAQQRIAYDMLINYPKEIGTALNEEMSAEWSKRRGIQVVSLAMESVTVDDASAKKIEQLQEARALSNPMLAAGRLAAGQASAMEAAANNPGGAMSGFVGMGMAQGAGGVDATKLFQTGMQQQGTQPPSNDTWSCACGSGMNNTGKFCSGCGAKKPETATWKCSCGTVNTAKFCAECGAKKPETATWKCSCGTVNTAKFCAECGAKKPTPGSVCLGCGWAAPDIQRAPKFCPECGKEMVR